MAHRAFATALSLAVGAVTFTNLSHCLELWKPPVPCGDNPFSLLPPPITNNAFLRTNIPFVDTQMCFLTQFFVEAFGEMPSLLGSKLIISLVVGVSLPFWFLMAVESTRRSSVGPNAYFSLIGFLSQTFGISVTIPFVWLPFHLYPNPATTLQPHQTLNPSLSKTMDVKTIASNSLGSVPILNRIAFGFLGLNFLCWLLGVTPTSSYNFKLFFWVFQYYPVWMVIGWASITLSKESRRPAIFMQEANVRSQQAVSNYERAALVFGVQHVFGIILPIATSNDPVAVLTEMGQFLAQRPVEKLSLVPWFLYVEGVSLAVGSAVIFVASEAASLDGNWVFAVVSYFARALLIGPGASLMVFSAWREGRIAALLSSGESSAKKLE
ncbi:UNVERIFIED_CONTAM: hypothetical protein HDU68_002301 [Siphonaria sp. JEL0065]|nr:hypothetical protein HDU68_002301 [Siphonaria sp. JEL0065]